MCRGATSFLTIVAVVFMSGCRGMVASRQVATANGASSRWQPIVREPATLVAHPESTSSVSLASFQESPPEPVSIPSEDSSSSELTEELELQVFVDEVVARHPSVQAMIAAWQAAAQRYPQAIALDDPMFLAMTAPGSLNSTNTEGAYALELRQKLPWFGKRSLRGDAALQEAAATCHEVQDARLKIALLAQLAYLEYFLADQQLRINEQNVELMTEVREVAQVQYKTNRVTQQDVLQADVELADLERRKLELLRMKKVAAARMNTLLLRSPELPLPAPKLDSVEVDSIPGDTTLLHSWALQNRPDLAALAHRVEVEAINVELAVKQFYPDMEFFGRYDTFWQPASTQGPLRGQIGLATNLPIYRRKLNAAVCEAQFRLQRQRAEYEQLANDIRLEVQTAWEQIQESRQTLNLYQEKLLPVSEQYLEAARSNYQVGKATFLDVVQAQRQLVASREKQIAVKTTLAQQLSELERQLGGTLP